MLSRTEFCLYQRPMNILPEDVCPFTGGLVSVPAFATPRQREARGASQWRKFQDLRAMSMTKNKRAKAAIPHQDMRILSCPAWFSSPRGTTATKKSAGRRREYGESVMELRVQLKICEGCGCLWYRAQTQGMFIAEECEVKLKDFPSPESRKRRGRPAPQAAYTGLEGG